MDGLRVGAAGSAAVEGIHILRAVLCEHLSQRLYNVSDAFHIPVHYDVSKKPRSPFMIISNLSIHRHHSCSHPLRLEAMYMVQ